ncbi:8444_t:CDS:2, partial [Racocetra persica]
MNKINDTYQCAQCKRDFSAQDVYRIGIKNKQFFCREIHGYEIKSEEGKLTETIDYYDYRGEKHHKYYLICPEELHGVYHRDPKTGKEIFNLDCYKLVPPGQRYCGDDSCVYYTAVYNGTNSEEKKKIRQNLAEKRAKLKKEEEHLESLGLQRQRCWLERLDQNSIFVRKNDNNNSHVLQAKVEIKKEIDKKESLLEQAKIDGDNEAAAKLEQQLQELNEQQKNNSTTENSENPNENKIIAYSIIGLSLMTFIGLIIDLSIRNYLYSLLPDIVRLETYYTKNSILIRPHLTEAEIILLLDKNNSRLETVLKGIYKIVNDEKISVKVDLKKVKKIYAHAQSIANLISGQLKKWIPVKQILKNVLAKVEYEPEIKGGGVEMKGILNNT